MSVRVIARPAIVWLLTWCLGIAIAWQSSVAVDEAPEETWQVIYLAGQRVGYGRAQITREIKNGKAIYATRMEEHLSIKRFGQQIKIDSKTQTEETEDGELIAFTWEMNNPPAQSSRSQGKVEGGLLTVETTIGGRTTAKPAIQLDAGVKSPSYQDRVLRKQPLKPGESRTFKMFVPEFAKITDVKLTADDVRPVKVHDGSQRNLLKIRMNSSLLPGIEMRLYVDDMGESHRVEADLLGMVTYTVPRDVALQELAGAELDVAVGTLVSVAQAPARLHEAKQVVYRLQTPGIDPAKYVAASETQTIERLAEDTIRVTVSSVTPPQNAPPERNKQQQYLGETTFLQVKDMRVQEHATRAAAGSLDPGTIALRMEAYVFKELKKKNFSTALASAAEVAQQMEGDCTEHACLLAAMLRAQNVPSRVAVGLVFADKLSAFAGHMWTEAWLGGKWVPLDATLGKGGIGPAHIKLTDSDLSDGGPAPVSAFLPLLNLLGTVKIDIVRVER